MQLTSLDQIDRQYRHVYLQPHFDDAALSSGGSIALQRATGQRVLIVTVFGGIPADGTRLSGYAQQIQQRTGLGLDAGDAVRQRRAEDARAAEVLGADTLWLDYLDAIYRGSPAYYQSEESLFGTINASDTHLDEELSSTLLNIYERAPLAAFYAPLGIGHHVDHQLSCSAADRLAQRKVNIKFYEDFPYVAQQGSLDGRRSELGIPMEPEVVEISGTMRLKEEAISQYTSQVPQLFGSEERMRQMVNGYASSLRRTQPGLQLERYWHW
ncbi:MAG TPA: PIG-L family deacetylase [Ktedonobacterales bacterium]